MKKFGVRVHMGNQSGDPEQPMIWGFWVDAGSLEEAEALMLATYRQQSPVARIQASWACG